MPTYEQCPLLFLCAYAITKKQWPFSSRHYVFYRYTACQLQRAFQYNVRTKARIYVIYCLDPYFWSLALLQLAQITSSQLFSEKIKFFVRTATLRHRVQSTSGIQGTPVLIAMGSSEVVTQISSARSEPGVGSLRKRDKNEQHRGAELPTRCWE